MESRKSRRLVNYQTAAFFEVGRSSVGQNELMPSSLQTFAVTVVEGFGTEFCRNGGAIHRHSDISISDGMLCIHIGKADALVQNRGVNRGGNLSNLLTIRIDGLVGLSDLSLVG